jgi:dolichol-phosphate mannosyltransferase
MAGLIAVGTAAWAVIQAARDQVVPGWTTIMIAVSFGTCAQLLMTGILGEYIGRIYGEVKRRPLYVIGEEVNVAAATSTVHKLPPPGPGVSGPP